MTSQRVNDQDWDEFQLENIILSMKYIDLNLLTYGMVNVNFYLIFKKCKQSNNRFFATVYASIKFH